MTSGGARNRSGPTADPDSQRSERRGYSLTALPAEGYSGPVPEWPMPDPTPRELAWWEWAWRTPQACAWSMPSEAWRVPFVAEWCQVKAMTEVSPNASLLAQKFRMEDRIGFSTAGLAEMGWRVTVDELSEKAAEKGEPAAKPKSSRDRLKVVNGGDG